MITPEILRKFDVPGPRYTSYPTADRFVEDFSQQDYIAALQKIHVEGGAKSEPLSIYFHIPFCESLCYYCACNKIITRHPERAEEYLRYLQKEVDLQVKQLGRQRQVSQLHFGGGTPTYLTDQGLQTVWAMVTENFMLLPDGEYSLEVDPRTVSVERLRFLRDLGFNRLSFGVQDFEFEVQKAVNRIQSTEKVFELVAAARELGFKSINIDLIYGLPKQDMETFKRTLDIVCQLRPDRIALYAYAHLPERFKPQRRIIAIDLPGAADKISMLASALDILMGAGYDYIGMDHFALKNDSLSEAKRQGNLHRNFQGYTTQPDCDLIAFGVSAIGRVGLTYSQNAKNLDDYYKLIDDGLIPIQRGVNLSFDDLLRRSIIMAIMCQGLVCFEQIKEVWKVDFQKYFSSEIEMLTSLEEQGLLAFNNDGFRVTEMGWFFVRGIAIVFDKYLQNDRDRQRFSRII